jgi:subtilase family serine protease
VYFSADEVVSGEDVALAQGGWTEAVAAGGSYNLARTVIVPSVPAGNYYLILRVDSLGYVYESDEGNNQRVATVEIRTPDLRPTGLTAPASAVTQHTMEISWTVENGGTAEAKASWYDIVYFSADEVVSGEDVALAQGGWTEAVAAGGSYNLARTVTVPSVPAGNYYLILRVDSLGYVYEADEGNNEFRRPIQVTGSEILRIVAIEPRPNGRLRIEFQSISGPSHHLESCDFIEEGLWVGESFYIAEDAAETVEQIEGTGDIMSIYVSPAGVRRFYRVAAP